MIIMMQAAGGQTRKEAGLQKLVMNKDGIEWAQNLMMICKSYNKQWHSSIK